MKKEDFIILAQKYRENKCTTEEKELVENFFDRMQELPAGIPSDEKGKVLFHAIKKNIGTQVVRKRKLRSLKIAAALFLIAGLTYTLNLATSSVKQITEMAARGERKEIVLQDGSIVVLNSNSSITYPESFGKTREIKLKGEAYFKVHRDVEKPFIVATRDVSVKVLGTSFNINSYEHNSTKVSVVTGKVQVTSPPGEKQLLTKNQQASFTKGSKFNLTKDDSAEGIAWTHNTIFLKNTTLAETAKIIENWYNIKVDFEDSKLETMMISGKFKDEKLENVLNSIAALKQLEIKYLTKNHVLIRKKRQSI